jgi:hypothetical protein
VALERSGELVSRVSSVMYNLNHAETNAELQKIVRDASPLLTEYGNDITLNEALFARIKAVYEGRHGLDLDAEDGCCWSGPTRASPATAPTSPPRPRNGSARLTRNWPSSPSNSANTSSTKPTSTC